MGGGEIVRYLSNYGFEGVGRAVIVSGVPPVLTENTGNSARCPSGSFRRYQRALTADRFAYFTQWNKNFFNLDVNLGLRVSAEAAQATWDLAVSASPAATIACVATWRTDFRAELTKIDIPVLVLHGSADRILPIEACGAPTHQRIAGSEYVVIEGEATGCAGRTPTRSTRKCCGSSSKRLRR